MPSQVDQSEISQFSSENEAVEISLLKLENARLLAEVERLTKEVAELQQAMQGGGGGVPMLKTAVPLGSKGAVPGPGVLKASLKVQLREKNCFSRKLKT